MMNAMSHDEAREALDAVALDALDASERMRILAHVRDCPACRDELAALEQTAEDLSYAAKPIAMSAEQRERVRARLLARAAADRAPGGGVVPIYAAPSLRAAETPRASRDLRWLAIAASIVAIGSIGLLVRTKGERDRLHETLRTAAAAQGASSAALTSLRAAVADRDLMIANLTGPQVAVMTLASNDPASPTGRMFWDQAHDAWVFVAHNLGHPKAGRTYQLWLVTASAKISAGTFSPGASGDALVRATYALPKDSLAAVAVTEEPEAGSPQPTSAPFLVATNGR